MKALRHRSRAEQVALGLLGLLVLYIAWGAVSFTVAVLHRHAERRGLLAAARAALPAGATNPASGFVTSRDAYAIADVTLSPRAVVSAYQAPHSSLRWTEISGAGTPLSRSYLSAGKNRILTFRAAPCFKERTSCPRGGSTVTADVAVGGPNS